LRVSVDVTPPRWAEKVTPTAVGKVVAAVWAVWAGADIALCGSRVVVRLDVADLTMPAAVFISQRQRVRAAVKEVVAPLRTVAEEDRLERERLAAATRHKPS
jgi:hypothetical protein